MIRRSQWGAAIGVALVAAACVPSKPQPPPTTGSALFQAACGGTIENVTAGQVQAADLIETSGVVASRANADVLWAHNDSGDAARVFAMTTAGAHLGTFELDGATNVDWEDIAIGPGPVAGQDYLYVADIGDNPATRPSIVVYRVAEPAVDTQNPPGDGQHLTGVETITLTYPDGAHDAETLLVDPDTGELVIVTKVAFSPAGVYARAGASSATTLTAGGSISLGALAVVTAGDVSPSGDTLVLRTFGNQTVQVFDRPSGQSIAQALQGTPCVGSSVAETQGEAIAITASGNGYLTISEGQQPPINRFVFS